jgi:hypothetical protein
LKVLAIILLLIVAFSGILLWKTMNRSGNPPQGVIPVRGEPREPPRRAQNDAGMPPGSLQKILIEVKDGAGRRHALCTSSSRRGLTYLRDGEKPEPLDMGIELGDSIDLAVDGEGRAYAAYWNARNGEVRLAMAGRKPQAWTSLRRLKRPRLLTLSTNSGGVLLSYYDEEEEVLHYSYWDVQRRSWRHGVASRGGGYRVATGKPGALVLRN